MSRKRFCDVKRTDILIRNSFADECFGKFSIDPKISYLMDVKKEIFKMYNLEPIMTVKNPRKTLSEQKPNNAFGIRITRSEMEVFMHMFGFSANDWYSELHDRIEKDILLR